MDSVLERVIMDKCENHTLSICCLRCMKNQIEAKNKLLNFVKSFDNPVNYRNSVSEFVAFYMHKECEAKKLLSELGED
jgi:hypothetical protein